MTRLIDADALFTDLDGMMAVSPTGYIHGDTVADMIGDQPTVDAVPVIRCRDCKFYSDDYRGANPEWHLCTRTKAYRTTDDYCSRAERKEE